MTLKEKLSLSRIEHFSLVLEQQHSISKLLLLHDEERIQQVCTHTHKLHLNKKSIKCIPNYISIRVSAGGPEERGP